MKPEPHQQSTRYLPSIDGLRGLAVVWIVVGHCWTIGGGALPHFHRPLMYLFGGYLIGVDLLFVHTLLQSPTATLCLGPTDGETP